MANELVVVDISHYQPTPNYDKLAAAGIVGVILKCTQGKSYVDPTFRARYDDAIESGMPVSTYHFLEKGDPVGQMKWYLKNLDPRPGERVCLDHEAESDGSSASLNELKQAVNYLRADERGLEITIYSGNLVKEQLGPTGYDETLALTSLWIAHYTGATSPSWPQGTWPTWSLWQYTDKASAGGISPVDGNRFNGSPENCAKWFGPTDESEPLPPPGPGPSVDLVDYAVKVSAEAVAFDIKVADGMAIAVKVNDTDWRPS